MPNNVHPLGKIPATLWEEASGILKLPPLVAKRYLELLSNHQLEGEAGKPRPDPAPIGGHSQEQTDLHFAHAFDGSVARAELALVDPHQHLPVTSSTLLRFLSGGSLCLVDVPCGVGAASLAFLSAIAELRASSSLPRLPLNVRIIGGEISAPARAYAEEFYQSLVGSWAAQAIFATYELMSWDVLCPVSNANIVEKIVVSKSQGMQTLIVVCNFNGFLTSSNKKKDAEPQLQELFKYSSDVTNAAVWIEPNMNAASNNLFPWIKNQLSKWPLFAKLIGPPDDDEMAECPFEIPFNAPSTAKVRLRVLPIELKKKNA